MYNILFLRYFKTNKDHFKNKVIELQLCGRSLFMSFTLRIRHIPSFLANFVEVEKETAMFLDSILEIMSTTRGYL